LVRFVAKDLDREANKRHKKAMHLAVETSLSFLTRPGSKAIALDSLGAITLPPATAPSAALRNTAPLLVHYLSASQPPSLACKAATVLSRLLHKCPLEKFEAPPPPAASPDKEGQTQRRVKERAAPAKVTAVWELGTSLCASLLRLSARSEAVVEGLAYRCLEVLAMRGLAVEVAEVRGVKGSQKALRYPTLARKGVPDDRVESDDELGPSHL
jgi:hypothetical protein